MAEVEVIIPEALRHLAGDQTTVSVDAETLVELFDLLAERYPDLIRLIRARDGTLRRFLNVYVDQDDIRSQAGLQTRLYGGEQIRILPSIAGG